MPAFHLDFAKDSSTTHGASPVSDNSAAATPAHANDACCVHPVPGWVLGAPHGEQPGHYAVVQSDLPGDCNSLQLATPASSSSGDAATCTGLSSSSDSATPPETSASGHGAQGADFDLHLHEAPGNSPSTAAYPCVAGATADGPPFSNSDALNAAESCSSYNDAKLPAAHMLGLWTNAALQTSSARPLPFGAELLSTSVAAEPHIPQVPAPTAPAGTVTSMPPGALLHASDDSANHDAADRHFHSGLIGLTAGSFVAPSRPCDAASYSYVNDEASRPFKIQKRALSSSSGSQPFANVLPDSAGHSLPMLSPGTPSPACLPYACFTSCSDC